jgi:hypothetical protein
VEADDLAALRLQQKAIADRIKELKAAEPKMTPLQAVIHRQQTQWEHWIPRMLANRVKARVNAGQDRAEAGRQVIEFFACLMDQQLDYEDADEARARQAEAEEEAK